MDIQPVLHGLLVVSALVLFGVILYRRLRLLTLASPEPRLDSIGARLTRMLVVGFGQSRQLRYPLAGILHILIFAGFLVLLLRSITLLGEGFSPGFTLPGLRGEAGAAYSIVKDYTALVVLVACLVAAIRRLFFRQARYTDRMATRSHTGEAFVILGWISALMIADAVLEGSSAILSSDSHLAMPFAGSVAAMMRSLPPEPLGVIQGGAFWIHNILLLGFLCYLPVSKHFHVITALPNVFLSKTGPAGSIKPPRYHVADPDDLQSLGVARLEDFTWKHILDFYSCTDCGRCSDHCPAYATGTPLSPRMISIKCRDLAYDRYPALGRSVSGDGGDGLVGELITPGELWACTTCGACEEACPVMIEYVDKIVDMRRHLVDEGNVPAALQRPLMELERRGNPYGKPARAREEWLAQTGAGRGDEAGVKCRVLGEGDQTDALFFTDSAAALDPRIREISRAFSTILSRAGVDHGTMGSDEVDSGNEVRRIGEEGLFESLRGQNVEAFKSRSFDRVVTTDPHAFNALRNDGYHLDKPVVHHSQMLAELIRDGAIELGPIDDDRTYTFHDPCYLGRHNGVYDDPREVLAAIPGLKVVEMERSRNRSFCCGGGSLNLFFENEGDTRMGDKRLEMARRAGAEVVVTACPFCLINLADAAKTADDGEVEIIDLAELVARSMQKEDQK